MEKHLFKPIIAISLLLIIFLSAAALSASAQNKDYVLVLNSINLEEGWTKKFYTELHERLNSQKELELKSFMMSLVLLKDKEEVEKLHKEILKTYSTPPKVVLIVGDPGWVVSAPLFDGPWKNIPVILCYSRERIPKNVDVLLNKETLTEYNTIPTSDLNKKYNLTILKQPYYIEETLNLIKRFQPDLKRIALISDYRYISMITQKCIREVMGEKFPELELESLSSESISTEDLLDTLNTYGKETGVIYCSWFRRNLTKGNNYLGDHLKKVLPTFVSTPVFTLADLDLEKNLYAGGYYISIHDFINTTTSIIERILKGEAASSIPYQNGGTPKLYLNYRDLEWHNTPKSLYPNDAIYYNKPPTFYQQYAIYLWTTGLFIIMTLTFYVFFSIRSRKQRLLKEKYHFFLESILENLPIPTKVIDVNNSGEVLIWNKKAEESSGIPASFMLKKKGHEVLKYTHPLSRKIEEEIVRTGKARTFIERSKNVKGEDATYLIYKRLVTYKDEQKWLVSSAINITEEEKIKTELIQAKEHAEKADQLKSAFLANMSHEIRTPLNAIVGFSSILAETTNTEENQEYIRIIEENNYLLLQLINDILDLSKIEAESLNFNYSNVSTKHCLQELEEAFRLRIPQNIRCIIDSTPDDYTIYTDNNRLIQILGNYLSNAIKYTTQGSITIGYYPPKGGKLRFFVRDTGCGIPADKHQLIFERFVKLDSFKQGTGLGLFICQMLAEKMEATIGVTSEVGKGSEFWLEVPC